MKPIDFPEQNKVLAKPPGMTDEQCVSLPVFADGQQCISCWKGSLRDRLTFLFTGRMWLRVLSGQTQPPVWVSPGYPFQTKPPPMNDFERHVIREALQHLHKSFTFGRSGDPD